MKILVAGDKINGSVLSHVADELHDQLLKYNIRLCRIPHTWIGLSLSIVRNCHDDCVVWSNMNYEDADRFISGVTGVKLVWIETEENIRNPGPNTIVLHDHPMDVRNAVARTISRLFQ